MKKYFAPLDIVGAPPKNTKIATMKEAENVWNEKMYKVLRDTFHYDEFRGKQKEVILNTLAGLCNVITAYK
jgi:superfamily II DNA helicase RecQ